MADSIREKIIKNVVTVLQGITETAGYPVTIQQVYRIPSSFATGPEYPFISVLDAGEEKEEGVPVQKTTCTLHLDLIFWNNEWTDVSERANQILASIQTVMQLDPTRGGNAYDTDEVSNVLFLADETLPYGGGSARYDILYRHKLSDPYSL